MKVVGVLERDEGTDEGRDRSPFVNLTNTLKKWKRSYSGVDVGWLDTQLTEQSLPNQSQIEYLYRIETFTLLITKGSTANRGYSLRNRSWLYRNEYSKSLVSTQSIKDSHSERVLTDKHKN